MKFQRVEIPRSRAGLVAESLSYGPLVRVRDQVMNLRVRVRDRVRHKRTRVRSRVRDQTRVTHHWV